LNLERLRNDWDALGRDDPFWAILSRDDRRGNRWDTEEFFLEGRREIDRLMAEVEGWVPRLGRGRALDFGCGAGRLTQALARHFERCDGVDIAPSMIELAEKLNRQGPRCRFHLEEGPDLHRFADRSFDLVYSNLVLMHMPPEYALRYIGEFVRVIRAQGLAVFQIATDEGWPWRDAVAAKDREHEPGTIQVHGLQRDEVTEAVTAAGGRILSRIEVEPISERWRSFFFGAVRAEASA
jgi:SAM-dependent methyltransferase